MGSTWSTAIAGRARRRQLGWVGSAALIVVGIIVFVPATGDSPTNNISFAAALPLWLLALSWPVWRAPARALPNGLGRRRRHRRICWRTSIVLLFLASFALIACAYWGWRRDYGPLPQEALYANAADLCGNLTLWLSLLAPVPGLLDALLWRLHPAGARREALLGAMEEALGRPTRYRKVPEDQRPGPGFDRDAGWLGRPRPVFARQPDPLRGDPLTIRPVSPVRTRGDKSEVRTEPRFPAWQQHGAISWDGRALFFTDARQRHLRVPIEEAAELVQVRESREYGPLDELMLLDAEGKYLVRMPATGFRRHEAAALAAAAGLPFACYELGSSDESGASLHLLLFPARRGARIFRIR
ncbi:hypothetical protein ACEZDB_01560 [Streptacidiphilus sp. N1-3]|uniref:WD40-like Beta Propeller Repeat n=1 Tax=Streptacidiphilus alkalitolerans TaxID=3342712 RepID=A0ABV6WTJ1_9ACTN